MLYEVITDVRRNEEPLGPEGFLSGRQRLCFTPLGGTVDAGSSFGIHRHEVAHDY